MPRGEIDEQRFGQCPVPPLQSADRAVGQERDVVRHAVSSDAVQEILVLPDIQLDLNGINLGDATGLLDLPDVHVAEPDEFDAAISLERGKRPDARCQRYPRVGSVKLIEVNALDAERAPAGFAGRDQVTRPPVRDPSALRPRQAALGGDADARSVAGPGCDRARNQPFVVPRIVSAEAIGVCRVEECDAGIKRGMQDRQRPIVVAIGLGRQTHAAERNARDWRRETRGCTHSRIVKTRNDTEPATMASQPQRRCPGSSHHM